MTETSDKKTSEGKEQNVVDLVKEKEKRDQEKSGKKGTNEKKELSLFNVIQTLIPCINHAQARFPLPPFPHRWYLIQHNDGVKACYEKREKGLHSVTEKYCRQELIQYVHRYLGNPRYHKYHLTMRQATEVIEHWISVTPAATPKLFSFQDDPEDALAYVRLPWTKGGTEETPTPLFDEFLSRSSNPKALQEWIGSIFIEESNLQQYVWLYGEGGDGKGALVRALEATMTGLFASKTGTFTEYSMRVFVGKRLVVIPDSDNPKFISSGVFKSLTGNDSIEVNGKFEHQYTYRHFAKILMASNERPLIRSLKSDGRRLIYIEITPPAEKPTGAEKDEYEKAILLESRFFFKKCVDLFISNRKSLGEEISASKESEEDLKELLKANHEDFASWVETDFKFGEEFTMRWHDLATFVKDQELKQDYRKVTKEFAEYLKQVHGIKHMQRREGVRKFDKKGPKLFWGISKRLHSER